MPAHWKPTARTRRTGRARPAWAVVTVLTLLVAPFLGLMAASAAPTGTLTELGITVTDDGSASPTLDPAGTNGLVATNSAVTMSWALRADNLSDGVVTQTLPEGWSWVTSSLGKLSSDSSLYQSAYAVSADGRTLTATISVPSASLVSISGLQAIPGPTAASGSVYTPELTATDATQTLTATGTALAVVSVPQVKLGVLAIYRYSYFTYDFGAGAEPAIQMQMRLSYRADTTLVGQVQPLELTLPQRLSVAYTGAEPDAVTVCGTDNALTLVSAADGTAVVDLGAQPTTRDSNPTLCFWYRTADLPVGAAQGETLSTTLTVPELTTTDGSVVQRSGNDTASTTVYADDPVKPVVPPRAATLAAQAYGYNWSSSKTDPTYPTYIRYGPWREVAESGNPLLSESAYTPSYDSASGTSVGTTDLVGYQFWDPSTATILDDASAIFVGQYRTTIDPSTYRLEFTNTRVTSSPGTSNTWFASIAEAGGPGAVSGVRVVYTGGVWAQGSASGTGSQLTLSVPLTARADGIPTQFSATHVWTAAEEATLIRSAQIKITPFSVSATITGSPSSVVGGSPLTYTVYPAAAHSVVGSPTAPDYAITALTTITLPPTITTVDVSAAVAAGWTLVSETPADLGPDGVPGTSDDRSGIVLVFSRDGVVPALGKADLPSFTLPVVTSVHAPTSQRITAQSLTQVQITSPTPTSLSANDSVNTTVLQGETLSMEGDTTTPRIAATDHTASWTTRWYNYATSGHDAPTYVMDVLPYDGDARGTRTTGKVTLTGVSLLGGAEAAGAVVEVTTAAPDTIGAAPGTGVAWTTLTDATDLSAVTAVRIALSGLATGSAGGFTLATDVTGHSLDDVLVNSATSASTGSTLTMDTGNVSVTVVGATLSGRVVIDTDRDGLATSSGDPAVGARVQLLDGESGTEMLTTVTDADGGYTFRGVGAGSYRVAVVPTSIAGAFVTPTVDPDDTVDGATDLTVGVLDTIDDLDFAFAVRNPAVTVSTVGRAPSGSLTLEDALTFTSTVTNAGDAPLTGLAITDTLPATGTWTWPGDDGALAPGEAATYTVSYPLTQQDLDAGTVSSTVQVTGTDDAAHPVDATGTAQVDVAAGAALSITGTGTAPTTIAADGTVRWTMTIENTGATTLTGVQVTDALAGISAYTITWPGTEGRLSPGERATATATSALTQAQVDAGTVTSTATATARTVSDTDITATTSTPVTFPVLGTVALRVEADGSHVTEAPGTQVTDGDDVGWTYTVTNNGPTTLHGVTVSDDRDPATAITAPEGFTGVLAPGDSVVFTATSVAVLGELSVTGTVLATVGDGDTAATATDTVWYTAVEARLGSITGRVLIDTARDGLATTDGTPATGVGVRLVDTSDDTTLTTVTDDQGEYRFTGLPGRTYRVEVDLETVTGDSVLVTVDPDQELDGTTLVTIGGRQELTGVDFALAVRNPALTLSAAGQSPSAALAAGDQVTFTYTLTNTGDVTLSNLSTPDTLDPTRSTVTAAWPEEEGSLAPGQQVTFTVAHTLDQAEVDAGVVSTEVHGEATDDLGTAVSTDPVTVQILIPSGAALGVTGAGTLPEQIVAGQDITWSVTVQNTGTVTLDTVTLDDALDGVSDYALTWPGDPGVLTPGESATATATSTLTQAQIDAGTVTAQPAATGTAPDGAQVTGTGSVPVGFHVPGRVRIEVTLNGSHPDAAPGTELAVGDALTWSYLVTNTGAATLHEVTVTDDLDTTVTAPKGFIGDLAPGESVTLTGSGSAAEGTWSPTASVRATMGDTDQVAIDSDRVWFTATAASTVTGDPGTPDAPSPDPTDPPRSTGQKLAMTGAGIAGVLTLALVAVGVGTGFLTTTRRTKD